MGKPTEFKEYERKAEPYRDPAVRLVDFRRSTPRTTNPISGHRARCMDCGVPFCQSNNGCPVYNLIPSGMTWCITAAGARRWIACTRPIISGIHRPCLPGACEGACVLGITNPAVTIKNIECAIIDRGFDEAG